MCKTMGERWIWYLFYNLSWIHHVHNSSKLNSPSFDLSIWDNASFNSSSVNSGTVPKSLAIPLNSSVDMSPLPSTSCLLKTLRSCSSSLLPLALSFFYLSSNTPILLCSISSFVSFTIIEASPHRNYFSTASMPLSNYLCSKTASPVHIAPNCCRTSFGIFDFFDLELGFRPLTQA